jgi:chromatin remodeling complex protein RSC6
MVRTAKTPATAPTTPVVEKTVKAKKPKVETVPVAPVATSATSPVVDVAVEPVDSDSLTAKLAEYSSKLQALTALVNVVKNDYKVLEKAVTKELKAAQKASKKGKRNAGNRAPSGFVKPTLISDELAVFLGKDKGSLLARTAVSKEINVYIRANSLQDKDNGRKINPDAKLAKLLKIQKGDELTYFNLQKYMKHHFVKTVVAPVAV